MILPEWLREIEEREKAASPGPWHWDYKGLRGEGGELILRPDHEWETGLSINSKEEDDDFIAHTRSDIPRLLALVRQMGEALGELVTLKDDVKHVDPEGYERRKPLAWQAARDALRLYQHGPEVHES